MTTETMLEKLARELESAIEDERRGFVQGSDETGEVTVIDAIALARVALQALLEPTEGMVLDNRVRKLQFVIDYVGPESPALHFIDNDETDKGFRDMWRAGVQAAIDGR